MSRRKLWLCIVAASLTYLAAKCAVGWMCNPWDTVDAIYWSGGALLLHWIAECHAGLHSKKD